jgi:hypothetical protein
MPLSGPIKPVATAAAAAAATTPASAAAPAPTLDLPQPRTSRFLPGHPNRYNGSIHSDTALAASLQ